jgi:hypothetical protein
LWLVGLPTLRRTLQMHQHDALAMRLGAQVHFEPTTDREAFISAINACLDGVGARSKLLSGIPPTRSFFAQAVASSASPPNSCAGPCVPPHERDQAFVDEQTMGIRRRRDPHRRRRQTGQGVLTLMGSPLPTRRAADLKTVPEEQRWLVRDLWAAPGRRHRGR